MEAGYLLEILTDLGWSGSSGFGSTPISYAELEAWSRLTQTALEPWEVECLRAASTAYCAQAASKDEREPNFEETQAKSPPVSAIRAMAAALNRPKTTDQPNDPSKS